MYNGKLQPEPCTKCAKFMTPQCDYGYSNGVSHPCQGWGEKLRKYYEPIKRKKNEREQENK